MESHHSWPRWRGDLSFFVCVGIGSAIAYPLDQPWRAVAFALASAAFIIALVVWSIVGRRYQNPEIDNAALFFYSYMAVAIAVAQFFEPPITAFVIIGFGFLFLLGMFAKSKLGNQQATNVPTSMNDSQT